MRDLGVDVIITDHPDELLRRLGRADSCLTAGAEHDAVAAQARSVSSSAAVRSPGVS